MFMNIISALMLFIVDNFSSTEQSAQNIYSALMIAFTAGMVAIFAANRLKSRIRVVLVGLFIAFYPYASGLEVSRDWLAKMNWFKNWMWY